MKIARISYTNTEPFFHFWHNEQFPLSSGVPRVLARAAEDNDIVAGPLPIVECWRLEKKFSDLGNWCIATQERSRSVFVFSRKPFSELNNVKIGVTRESSTSVALCSVLIQQKYNHTAQIRRGLEADDEAWLVIGDQALTMGYSPSSLAKWTYVTDLATEWWTWQKKPFVFAQWVASRQMDPPARQRLLKYLQYTFNRGIIALPEIAEKESKRLRLQPELIVEYLKGFIYQLTPEAEESIKLFREMVTESASDLAASSR